ncbi:MAG: urease accessory protein UreE [Flavobacteriaceae bacterium]|jgi:urease accessory protein|nr:urease accessory protein UreE [Flavobacteriaceae bacterium]
MLKAYIVHHNCKQDEYSDSISLSYSDRFLRRKTLMTDGGMTFVLELEQTTSLADGDQIEIADGKRVRVKAKSESLAKITGTNLLELAWHIGNRHTPCQIASGYLLIQTDHVIEHMIKHLGGSVEHVIEPFTPLGGAYGHGRTNSHEHGASAHAHAH